MATHNIEDLRILVIEDEPHIRAVIRQILSRLKVESIYEAEEGGDGFMQTLRLKPYIVLCDIHMKPVDGLSYLSNLRKSGVPGVMDTPVVFLTSDANEEVVSKAMQFKVNGYIVKPCSVTT